MSWKACLHESEHGSQETERTRSEVRFKKPQHVLSDTLPPVRSHLVIDMEI